MISVEIRGKQFPLCLTVAAIDEITAKCGGMGNLHDFLFPKASADNDQSLDLYRQAENLTWMLGLLIREGEENRVVNAQFFGDRPERVKVPGSTELAHLFKVGEVFHYSGSITAAISESFAQTIEAKHEKNVPHAG